VQNAWKNRSDLEVHGWVIQLDSGYVKDLNVSVRNADNLGNVFSLNKLDE
jgi:carbonic anhydrase